MANLRSRRPIGNLIWGALCLLLQRVRQGPAPRRRLFFWAGAMFAFFWEFGYLLKCSVSGRDDAMALVEDLDPPLFWRGLLFVAGLILYRGAIRLLAGELHFVVRADEPGARSRVRRIRCTLYLAGGFTACAGAVLDPRGPGEILYPARRPLF